MKKYMFVSTSVPGSKTFFIWPPPSWNRFSPTPFALFKNRFGPVHFYHKQHAYSNITFNSRLKNYTKSRPRHEHGIPTPEPIHSHLDGHGLPNVRDGRNFWRTRIYETDTTSHCPTKPIFEVVLLGR